MISKTPGLGTALGILFMIPSLTWAGAPAAPSAKPIPAAAAAPVGKYKIADEHFQNRRDRARATEALALYRKLYAESPADPESGWRVAMGCYFTGIRMTQDDKEKEKLYTEGREAGLASIKAAGDKPCAPCHFWTAINMALYGETVGVFKMLFSLNDIKEHLKKSIEADDKYAYSGAYRLLGLIEQKVPGILGGSDKRAREYFEKAIATSPDEPLNYLFLARLLEDKFDDKPAALAIAKKGLTIPMPAKDRLEAVEAMDELMKFVQNGGEKQARRNKGKKKTAV